MTKLNILSASHYRNEGSEIGECFDVVNLENILNILWQQSFYSWLHQPCSKRVGWVAFLAQLFFPQKAGLSTAFPVLESQCFPAPVCGVGFFDGWQFLNVLSLHSMEVRLGELCQTWFRWVDLCRGLSFRWVESYFFFFSSWKGCNLSRKL